MTARVQAPYVSQVNVTEDSFGKFSPGEVSPVEVSPAEVSPGEVSPAEGLCRNFPLDEDFAMLLS
jgi:hypothetical protein